MSADDTKRLTRTLGKLAEPVTTMTNDGGLRRDKPRPWRSIPLINGQRPIEFVLVGPKGRDHGIVARSNETRIDLIGFSASDREELDVNKSNLMAQLPSRGSPCSRSPCVRFDGRRPNRGR